MLPRFITNWHVIDLSAYNDNEIFRHAKLSKSWSHRKVLSESWSIRPCISQYSVSRYDKYINRSQSSKYKR
jgi:hypothetical protein